MTASLADQANRLISEGRHREALEVMDRFGDPAGNAPLLENIGVCHYRLGAHKKALAYLRRAHQAAPDDARTINNIALISSEVGAAEVMPDLTLDDILARADESLYQAKEAGRARLIVWQDGGDPETLAAAG